jgi:hypothetical protein
MGNNIGFMLQVDKKEPEFEAEPKPKAKTEPQAALVGGLSMTTGGGAAVNCNSFGLCQGP